MKDKVEAGEVSIEHKPTDQMWSDVLTKPKQGAAFRKDRAMLMNCDEEYNDDRERQDIPSILLPIPEGPVDPDTIKTIAPQSILRGKDRRSVLENKQKT